MMSRQEKHAWFNLAVLGLALIAYAVLVPVLGPRPAIAGMGLCGLWGLGGFLFYPRGRIVDILDERDLSIQRRATRIAHGTFWMLFVATCMLTWHFKRGGTVPADILPLMVGAGMVVVIVVGSIATLVLYRRGIADAEG